MITVVDYGMGNLGSIVNMFKRLAVPARLASTPAELAQAEKLVLPGVGAFDAAMERIAERGLRQVLDRKALEERVPILGICLGMQLLTRGSEEGRLPGLGWLPAETRRFQLEGLKIPHMGWNEVTEKRANPLTRDLPPEPRFYFVHSYYVVPDDAALVLMEAHYGYPFAAVVGNGTNLFGAQFHPEKSHRFGMRLLANFSEV